MPQLNCIIDISHHQSITDFSALNSAGITHIIHKATQGFSIVDKKYITRKIRWRDEMGLPWGSYHFLGKKARGDHQAEFYLNTINDVMPNELTCLDYEHDNGVLPNFEIVESFIEYFEKAANDKQLVIYVNNSIYNNFKTRLSQYPIWIARYSKRPDFNTYKLWQYTENGELPGISICDRDYFNGTEEELNNFWK